MPGEMKVVTFICEQCGDTNKVRMFPAEQPAAALNCTKCGKGQGLTVQQQLQANVGMFPRKEETVNLSA